MLDNFSHPTLMISLQIGVDEAISRIKCRGRDYEQIVERSYWEDLNDRYRSFFMNYKDSPLSVIDVTDMDFEHNSKDKEYVMDLINQKLIELGHEPLTESIMQ